VIPESFKQDLLNRVDIVDVINARVPLKKAGANWSACCPFHTEKTPSFTVSPSKQFYHCFGCGAHGNAIGFLMEYAGLGYIDALRDLADMVGMKLPEMERRRDPGEPEGPDLYDFMARAAKFYREQLKGSSRAIEYLKSRGLTGQTAVKFGIGYAPNDWQGLQPAFPEYGEKPLVDCGLVIVNEQGRRYDRFRDRVMFPILNQRGFVIGFGGRVIPEGFDARPATGEGKGSPGPATGEGKGSPGPATGEGKGSPGPASGEGKASPGPKYMNSPETALFEKGRELYGLPQARIPVREKGRVVVVEGYMDVVMLAQHGVGNAVATLGTATTATHVQKLLKLTDEIVFCFDGDAAGRRAAWHALEVSLEALTDRKTVRFLFLPTEHDPDSYVREYGAEGFEARIADADTLSAYLLAHLKAQNDLATLEGRAKLLAEAKPLLKRVAAPALQMQLQRALADLTGLADGEVARLADLPPPARVATANDPRRRAPAPPSRARANRSTESKLLRAILARPELADRLPVEWVKRPAPEAEALREVAEALRDHGPDLGRPLSGAFEERPYRNLLVELEADLLVLGLDDEGLTSEFEDGLRRLHEGALAAQLKVLESKEKDGGLGREERDRYAALIREHAALRRALGTPI
jgi:DNA primase